MGIPSEGNGREGVPRGRVVQGRYGKMRDGSFSGNRWAVLDDESENEDERRSGTGGMRGAGDRNVDRSRSVEMEDIVEEQAEREKESTEREGNVGEGGRKRNLEERSPGVHDGQRVNRRRVNEFDMGKMFDEVVKKMGREVDNLIERAPDGFKKELKEGLEIMMSGMKSIMNGVSDRVASERLAREAEEIRTEDKMEKIMDEVKEIKNVSKGMVNDRMEQRVKASEREMEEKVKSASCCLKILDMDLGEIMEDRARMVRTVIAGLKGDIYPDDRRSYERIMRRTRVIILGKKTVASSSRGRSVYTVPVLLECQSKSEAGDLDAILKRAGYFSTFHWPQEMVSFVEGVRDEVRKMGHYGTNAELY